LANHRHRTADPDVAARFVLQRRNTLGEVALELLGVPPRELQVLA
jgi:hypothetical protein